MTTPPRRWTWRSCVPDLLVASRRARTRRSLAAGVRSTVRAIYIREEIAASLIDGIPPIREGAARGHRIARPARARAADANVFGERIRWPRGQRRARRRPTKKGNPGRIPLSVPLG